jgi:hypothetical protein
MGGALHLIRSSTASSSSRISAAVISFLTNYLTTGQAEYTIPGTYYWTAPNNVSNVSVLVIGAGGRGGNYGGGGGGGGGTSYVNNLRVVAGNVYTIQVGLGGGFGDWGVNDPYGANGISWFNASNYIFASGGQWGTDAPSAPGGGQAGTRTGGGGGGAAGFGAGVNATPGGNGSGAPPAYTNATEYLGGAGGQGDFGGVQPPWPNSYGINQGGTGGRGLNTNVPVVWTGFNPATGTWGENGGGIYDGGGGGGGVGGISNLQGGGGVGLYGQSLFDINRANTKTTGTVSVPSGGSSSSVINGASGGGTGLLGPAVGSADGRGGNYGGGGAGAYFTTSVPGSRTYYGRGANGAVRIMWPGATRSYPTENTANIKFSSANVGVTGANVYFYIDGGLYTILAANVQGSTFGVNQIPQLYAANSYTQIVIGAPSRFANPIIGSGFGWDGQISEIRISSGRVYPISNQLFVFNTSNRIFTPPTSAFTQNANTLAIFKARDNNTWAELINEISVPVSGVYSITSDYPNNGVDYSLNIRNRSNTSPGLIIDGPNIWGSWPITIEWWARASSAIPEGTSVIFKTSNVFSATYGNGTFFQLPYDDPTNANTYYAGVGRYTNNRASPSFATNTWIHYAITIEK